MSEEKRSFEQDIRIIQLSRWQIPKSKSVMNHIEDTCLSIGYFDMIDIREVKSDNIHPLLAAYLNSHRRLEKGNQLLRKEKEENDSILEDYTMQELYIFTDVDEEKFSRRQIEEFWKMNSLIMLVSLIHVDNESKMEGITQKIRTCFAGKKFLYYFSFDYSGIVLLAKEMGIGEYLQLMFKLNYDNETREKLIRDSYSFYGFHKEKLKVYFEKFENHCDYENVMLAGADMLPGYDEQFAISVNVGIQNYNLYREFREEMRKITPNVEEYGLLGRHDISLVNKDADLKWLIYIQYLLDKYTTKVENRPTEQLLFTHETFVKISQPGDFVDTISGGQDLSYERARKRLDYLCKAFITGLDSEKYNGEYGIPIQAVKYSILSILKNRFAEDFVLCMYQSFCEFIEYLTEKMMNENDDVKKFDECFNNYFRGLNSLVNSAMHSERQFIQATAFNAIIYDVPSKIMAFYTAMIDRLQQLMRTENDRRYTFLLTPSFSNEISVKIISYSKEQPPHDRILMVSINERSLYNPKAVIRRMAHEVAHFVGEGQRNRESRKKYIKRSIIYIILSHILPGSFLMREELFELISAVETKISDDKKFADGEDNYSDRLLEVMPDIADKFILDRDVELLLCQYIESSLMEYLGENGTQDENRGEEKEILRKYLVPVATWHVDLTEKLRQESFGTRVFTNADIQTLKNLIYSDIKQEIGIINKDREQLLSKGWTSQSMIARMGSGILNDRTVGEYVKGLISTYSEAFSDIQLVLLTGIGYVEYLEGFIEEEKIDLKSLSGNMEHISRISMVVMALWLTGVWMPEREIGKLEDSQKDYENVRNFHEQIERHINILKGSILREEKEKLEKYYGIASILSQNVVEMEEVDSIWHMDETAENVEDNIIFYIHENLLFYLVECIEKSMNQYGAATTLDKIKQLRSTIRKVFKFEEVEETFLTICNEIKSYKDKVFGQ